MKKLIVISTWGLIIQPLSALFSSLTILLFLIPQFRVFGQTPSLEDVYGQTTNYIGNIGI